MNDHTAQGDTDKGVLDTVVSKTLLPYKRFSKTHKEHSNPQFLIYSYKKKNTQTKTQNILEILSSHTQTPINAGNPSGALVLFLKWLYTLGMSLGSFCAIRKRKESFTYLVKLAFFHVLWKLGACTAKRVTRVLTRGAKIVQFKSRSDFLKQAKALPSEIQCQE